ncbi:MAG: YibE/F family protein, partial [Rhodococcus sp.]|nr:YibE/F family protein [Rhodococcus sp. (in: high G+C Gram-positive bacteria)]
MSTQHGHGHGHGHGHSGPIPVGPTAAKIVIGLLIIIGVAVLGGAVALWPSQQSTEITEQSENAGLRGPKVTESGVVVRQDVGPCGSPSNGLPFSGEPTPPASYAYECQRSLIRIESGPDAGSRTLLEI